MEIENLVIVAAPSGAGKTTFSLKVIDGYRFDFLHLIPEKEIERFDAKKLELEDRKYSNVIIEQALNDFNKPGVEIQDDVWRLIDLAEQTQILTLQVDRKEIGSRYIRQLFGAVSRRTPVWMRALQIQKWYQYTVILVTRDVEKKYKNWKVYIEKSFSNKNSIKLTKIDKNYNTVDN